MSIRYTWYGHGTGLLEVGYAALLLAGLLIGR